SMLSLHIRASMGLLLAPIAAVAQPAQRIAVLTTPHFAFFSDFDTNLNDALIEAGRARKAHRTELFQDGVEAACFKQLSATARAGWDDAVVFYADSISPQAWTARPQYLLR